MHFFTPDRQKMTWDGTCSYVINEWGIFDDGKKKRYRNNNYYSSKVNRINLVKFLWLMIHHRIQFQITQRKRRVVVVVRIVNNLEPTQPTMFIGLEFVYAWFKVLAVRWSDRCGRAFKIGFGFVYFSILKFQFPSIFTSVFSVWLWLCFGLDKFSNLLDVSFEFWIFSARNFWAFYIEHFFSILTMKCEIS